MVSKRQVREEGHRRKFLAVVDDTPESDKAIHYTARRVKGIDADLVLVYIIEPDDFQHWLSVEDVMRAEARADAETELTKASELALKYADIKPELVIREGKPVQAITELINEDHDIALMVLAAAEEGDSPGPLVSAVGSTKSAFPIPVTIVPATLTDADIDDLV